MRCFLCGCELRGFADGVMVERRIKGVLGLGPEWKARGGIAKILVCKDDDACGARRVENEQRRAAGE